MDSFFLNIDSKKYKFNLLGRKGSESSLALEFQETNFEMYVLYVLEIKA